jgi:inner membrane protein
LGSPFWNPWLYGDFIFIVEPLIWICTLPLVFYTAQSKISRSLAVFLGIILMLLVWSCKFNPWTVALGLTLFGIFFIFIQKTFRNSIPAILGITFILMSFKLGSHLVKKEVEQVLHQTAPQSISQQLSTTPAPGNPFCWSIISLSTDSAKDLYLVQKGNYSFLPNLFPPQTCALRMSPSQLAESHPSTLLSTSHLVWTDEFRKSLQEFKQLEKDSCAFRSFLKFSRIPIWFQFQGSLAAIDLRYDQKDRQFTWVDLNEKQNCPEVSPPWRYPTEGIFNPIKAQD